MATTISTRSFDEGVLVGPALLVAQPRVIAHRAEPAADECGRQLFDLAAPDAVHDAGLVAMALDGGDDLAQAVGPRPHAIDEVRPIERADEDLGVPQAQLGDDVAAYLRRRRRRVGVDGDLVERLPQRAELPVLRAKVVAPLADAVRLVHREEGGGGALQPLEEPVHHQPLGRQVEQLHAAGGERAHHRRTLGRRLAAVEHGGGHAGLAQAVDLVLHERDQRRDDDGETATVRGGGLVAERLAAARGQHDERVTILQHAADGLFLQREKAIVAPDAPNRLVHELSLDDGAMIAERATSG